MEKEFVPFLIIFLICMALVSFAVLSMWIPIYRINRRISGDSKNYSRVFVYSVPHTKKEIIERLAIRNIYDDPAFEFDPVNEIITFNKAEFRIPVKYKLTFSEENGYTLLRAEQIDHFIHFEYGSLQDPFWTEKFDAKSMHIYITTGYQV